MPYHDQPITSLYPRHERGKSWLAHHGVGLVREPPVVLVLAAKLAVPYGIDVLCPIHQVVRARDGQGTRRGFLRGVVSGDVRRGVEAGPQEAGAVARGRRLAVVAPAAVHRGVVLAAPGLVGEGVELLALPAGRVRGALVVDVRGQRLEVHLLGRGLVRLELRLRPLLRAPPPAPQTGGSLLPQGFVPQAEREVGVPGLGPQLGSGGACNGQEARHELGHGQASGLQLLGDQLARPRELLLPQAELDLLVVVVGQVLHRLGRELLLQQLHPQQLSLALLRPLDVRLLAGAGTCGAALKDRLRRRIRRQEGGQGQVEALRTHRRCQGNARRGVLS
mmetsp:Transcript_47254/g.136538  ORF Transcript_47254/g.136538 Transcript_47254/m.136538 type:complete len:334 (-) Transcript_47254:31-1032(-)